ncbi:MAG: FAD-dependent oxidoreductase [Hyphomicrobiaceae bacterium]|nr:MAG: FAD-dependent oxidoreductase [Hyphomicrobiaceae bacterium]
MKTILMVKAALLPLPMYLLSLWLGAPFMGAAASLVYALAWALVAHKGRMPPPFELALIGGLGAVLLAHVGSIAPLVDAANAILLAFLALGAVVSVIIGRPWTAEFSAGEFKGASRSRLFQEINTLLSGLWAIIFAWLALASGLQLGALAHWLPVGLGALISVIGPKLLVTRGLAKMAAGDQRNNWPAPDFRTRRIEAADGADAHCDVAVIGAGIGGLTAAALLADAGLQVAVYEHHNVPGGFAHTWLRRARSRDPLTGEKLVFRFDSGVHDISGWQPGGPVRSVFERLGIASEAVWHRLDHRYVLDGKTIDVPRDWRTYARRLADLYPEEGHGIEALFEDIHTVYCAMFSTAHEHGGIPGSPRTPQDLLDFARNNPLAVEWLDRPWSEFVSRHVRGGGPLRWISALSGYITDEPAKAKVAAMAPIFGYYFNGGYYPEGGSGRMGDALAKAIGQRGGSVHLKHRVTRIITRDGAACGLVVRNEHGMERRVSATAVVCNADLGAMLNVLLDDPATARTLESQTGPLLPACSAVGVHLGLRGPLDLPPLVHVETPDGAVGVVVPSRIDPTCAPAGYATVELLELVGNTQAQSWFPPDCRGRMPMDLDACRRSQEYEDRKKAVGDRLIARAKAVIPDIEERIVYRTDASPLTYHRYALTTDGSIYGMKPSRGTVPTKTPLRSLVLAGAATHGPGIEAVVISGALAAEALVPGLLAARGHGAQPRPMPVEADAAA